MGRPDKPADDIAREALPKLQAAKSNDETITRELINRHIARLRREVPLTAK